MEGRHHLAPVLLNEQRKTAAVGELVSLGPCFREADFRISERYMWLCYALKVQCVYYIGEEARSARVSR
jgi:hypothetical protein